MKKFYIVVIGILLLLVACSESGKVTGSYENGESDYQLVQQIQASNLLPIPVTELPNPAHNTLNDFEEVTVESAKIANELGYEVKIQKDEAYYCAYFDIKGKYLKPRPGDMDWGDKYFVIVYPLTFTMPDGSEMVINSEEEKVLLREWYADNPGYEGGEIVLQYPIQAIFRDGTIITLNNEDELKRLFNMYDDGKIDFRFIYPLTFIMPDGSFMTINSEDEKILLREWYANNPGYEDQKVELQFPIQVELKDGTIITLNNQAELDRLYGK